MIINNTTIRTGERVEVHITGITHTGSGVGRYQGLAVFIPGTIPGDEVLAEVLECKKKYVLARALEIMKPSSCRVAPKCDHYAACGGCRLQHAYYEEQLRLKTGLVRDSLRRIGGLDEVVVSETLGMQHPWHYRNKVHFKVEKRDGRYQLGFYEEGSHNLTDFFSDGNGRQQGCLLVDTGLNQLAFLCGTLLNKYGGGDLEREPVFFRHLVLRKAFFTGEMMAVIVTGEQEWRQEKDFAFELISQQPGITSLVRSVHTGKSGEIMGKEFRLLAGRDVIYDRLNNLTFRISPDSFYQVNPLQTLILYGKAEEFAALNGGETVLDAYSGIGTIALYLAQRARKVYGIEVVPAAVEDARHNAVLNKSSNAEFLTGQVERLLPALARQGLRPDVVILDPPRKGCGREALDAVIAMKVPRLVYVSCDPGTLARDLGYLTGKGYQTREAQPVDMFPWSHHTECVAICLKK
ncbi:MAG: 23S rRNA (uracil(1939)-C(5))-methyltransferase RlmD [Desulfotomaculaceae bacterium]|nr:23S rRNA (uracil(1939)-C(5))-methyltransferase RlmD [Desulfotomaculaceae bacterium]